MTPTSDDILMGNATEGKDGTFFSGAYPKQIDPKSRIPLPKPFRDLLGEGVEQVILVRGLDRERLLEVWPVQEWERRVAQVRGLNGAQKRKTLMRGYVSQAIICNLDSQGRLVVPPYYRDYAALEGDVLWIGGGTMMELWSKTRFEERDDALRDEAYQVFLENEDQFSG